MQKIFLLLTDCLENRFIECHLTTKPGFQSRHVDSGRWSNLDLVAV